MHMRFDGEIICGVKVRIVCMVLDCYLFPLREITRFRHWYSTVHNRVFIMLVM